MKSPPCLLGTALLFWGWQAGFPVLGAVLAVVLETAHWVQARREFSGRDFNRIWTFCSLLLVAAVVYAFNANNGLAEFRGFLRNPSFLSQRSPGVASARSLAAVLRWLPMIYFLFMAAQAYSSREGVPLETISFISRRRGKMARKLGLPPPPSRLVDISYPYFALCLFSASYHASEDTTFYWGLAVLLAWALWSRRAQRFGLAPWVAALVAAVALGYCGQRGLGNLQRYVSNLNPTWLLSFTRRGFDYAQSRTELGQLGRAKGSGKIVIRLEPRGSRLAPNLLRAASYRTFKSPVWYSDETNFERLVPERNGANDTTYVLVRGQTNLATVNIACYLPGGKGLLPLPTGSGRLENLLAFDVGTNSLGAVFEKAGPGLVIFDAFYGPGRTLDSAPAAHDVHLASSREIPALEQVISELDLRGKSLDQALGTLQAFFQGKFRYGYWEQRERLTTANETPLSRFLLRTRCGHCEYFATATVLLLRQLGFPARYAVGYAVHEARGRGYVVRQRDGHAWCLVWRAGTWQDFDTTPASWVQAEQQRASPLQFLSDLWSGVWFELSKFFWGQGHLRRYILWSLAPVLALLLYRIIFHTGRRRRRRQEQPSLTAWPGLDSEFYQVERLFAQRGVARQASEPLSLWLGRVAADPRVADARAALQDLLRLHYRYRFDPLGLSPSERVALRREARACLAKIPHAGAQSSRAAR